MLLPIALVQDSAKTATSAFEASVPLLQTLLWCMLIASGLLLFRKHIIGLLSAIEARLKTGSPVKVGNVEIGSAPLVTKTADVATKAEVFGNPDRFQLLFKAKSSHWSNSTKAMQLPTGCLVQVTNEHLQADGSWVPAEALAFVPGVVIRDDPSGTGRYLATAEAQAETQDDEPRK